jgi:hypothetical protein
MNYFLCWFIIKFFLINFVSLVDVKLIKTLNVAGEIIAKKEEIKKMVYVALFVGGVVYDNLRIKLKRK